MIRKSDFGPVRKEIEDGDTMIRAIFWDNDGVLVDTEKIYFQATRELLQKAGVELTEELFRRISLKEGRSAFDLALEKGIPQWEVDRLHEERNRRYTFWTASRKRWGSSGDRCSRRSSRVPGVSISMRCTPAPGFRLISISS